MSDFVITGLGVSKAKHATFARLVLTVIVTAFAGLMIDSHAFARPPLKIPEPQSLPGTKKDLKFDKRLAKLDLEDDERYEFHFKYGGTSIGFKVARRGKRKAGLFLPPNSATHINAEVITYRLSRVLGVSRLTNPAGYYTLGPRAIARFKRHLRNERQAWRRTNTRAIRAMINKSPNALLGVYKFRPKRRTQSVDLLTKANSLNTNHPLARFLKASGPYPGTKPIKLRGIRADKRAWPHPMEREDVLVRQLSTIFVLDMLTGQWDRFSGGNIEIIASKKGKLRFIARDNGGGSPYSGWSWFNKYARWVTRYDRQLVQELRRLHGFLDGSQESFAGFRTVAAFKTALGFLRNRSFWSFRAKLKRFVTKHLPVLENRYKDRVYFKEISAAKVTQQID